MIIKSKVKINTANESINRYRIYDNRNRVNDTNYKCRVNRVYKGMEGYQ